MIRTGHLTPWRRRTMRRRERFISSFALPAHVERLLRNRRPLDDIGCLLIARGLREWFTCCLWRHGTVLGMPSRLVDEAWHAFILDTHAYSDFCSDAFGEYLHHTPEGAMAIPAEQALANTVHAWDRSWMGGAGESVLWDLDAELGIEDPLGIDAGRLAAYRNQVPAAVDTGPGGTPGRPDGDAGDPGGADVAPSCGGGGGCGGGS